MKRKRKPVRCNQPMRIWQLRERDLQLIMLRHIAGDPHVADHAKQLLKVMNCEQMTDWTGD